MGNHWQVQIPCLFQSQPHLFGILYRSAIVGNRTDTSLHESRIITERFAFHAVGNAFRQAEQQLRSLPQAEYEALCAHLACGASTSGCEELIFSAEDRERVGAAVTAKANELLQKAGKPAQLTLSAETRPIRGGVVLKNGLIETNCSLGTLVDGLRPELSGKVAARLFG